MTASTWEQREQPILEAIASFEEAGEDATNESVAAATGLEPSVVGRTMRRLDQAGFISAADATSMGDPHPVYVEAELLERGLRVVGQWPPEVADAFLGRLDAAIAAATDPDERTRLERLRSAAGDVGKAVVSGAIVAAGQWGLGGT